MVDLPSRASITKIKKKKNAIFQPGLKIWCKSTIVFKTALFKLIKNYPKIKKIITIPSLFYKIFETNQRNLQIKRQ